MSNFKVKVLKIVKNIPEGEVLTYSQVAKLTGKPKAYRAVGNILNKNYDSKIPCHRVVGSNNYIGGYNRGVSHKIELLKKEGIIVKDKV